MAHISLVRETETRTYSEPETPPVDPDDRARIRKLASELLRLSESGYLYAKKTEEHTRRIVEVCDKATQRATLPAPDGTSGSSGRPIAAVDGYPQQPQPPSGDAAGSSPPRGTQGRQQQQQANNSRRASNTRSPNPVLYSPKEPEDGDDKESGSKTSTLMNAIQRIRRARMRGGQPKAIEGSGAQHINLRAWTEDDWVILEPEPQDPEPQEEGKEYHETAETTDSVKDDTSVREWTLEDWDLLEGDYENGTFVLEEEPETPESPADSSRGNLSLPRPRPEEGVGRSLRIRNQIPV